MEIALIGDRHTVYGFSLSGIRKTFVIDDIEREKARETMKGLFNDNIGILLLTESAAESLKDILEELKRTKKGLTPIVLEIPDSSGPLVGKIDPVGELIRRTVGFEIA